MPRSYQLEYYYRNKDNAEFRRRRIESRRKRLAEKKRVVNEYKAEKGCADCGEKDFVVLEFDHINDNKTASVCNLIDQGSHWKTIWAEIAKCEVVCCNCHRRRTVSRRLDSQVQ